MGVGTRCASQAELPANARSGFDNGGYQRRRSGLLHLDQPTFAMLSSDSGWCQSTKSLCDSGEVRLGLSIIPMGEIAGSGGSALS